MLTKWKKICYWFVYAYILRTREYFENKQWYRRLRGGTWYLICEFQSGDEYWTRAAPGSWEGIVVETERYEV